MTAQDDHFARAGMGPVLFGQLPPVEGRFLEDLFEGLDGTPIEEHAPLLGGPWVKHPSYIVETPGDLEIRGNALETTANDPQFGYAYNAEIPPSADYAVEAVFSRTGRTGGNQRHYVSARTGLTSTEGYRFGLNGVTNRWQLQWHIDDDSGGTIAASPVGDKQRFRIRLEVEGTHIRGFVDEGDTGTFNIVVDGFDSHVSHAGHVVVMFDSPHYRCESIFAETL